MPAVGDDIVAESEAPSVAEARAIIRAEQAGQSHAASPDTPGPAPLICAGTADPFYDQACANAPSPRTCTNTRMPTIRSRCPATGVARSTI